jgi:basic membrane protein A
VKKIALLLPGPITDESWNQGAYEGAKKLEAQGYEIAYTEDVQAADMESVFRSYCNDDFDFIIGHGVQYGDACVRVAEDFPDRYFFITGNPPDGGNLPTNIAFYDYRECEGAFVFGAFAALMTESGIIGYVGGAENSTQLSDKNAFIEGARYIDPNVEVKAVITGDFNDSALGTETAIAMIEQGVDVILQTCDHTGLGVLNACNEFGIFCFGYTSDQAFLVDDGLMLSSLLIDIPHMISSQIAFIEAGTFGGLQTPGLADGVVAIAPFSSRVPKEIADKVNEIIQKIKSGEIVVTPSYIL